MMEEKNRELKQGEVEEGAETGEAQPAEPAESAIVAPGTEMATLKKLLDVAIEEENYEEAARLRDRIRAAPGALTFR